MNNMYLKNVEKWLKHSLKKRISINTGMLVAFLITGFLGFTGEAFADKSMEEFKKRIASDPIRLHSSAINLNSGAFQSASMKDQFNVLLGSQGDNFQLSYVNGRLNSTVGPSNYIGFKRKDIILDSEVRNNGVRMLHMPDFDPKGNTWYQFSAGDILKNVTFSDHVVGGKNYIEGYDKDGNLIHVNKGEKIDYIRLKENRKLYLSGNLKDSLMAINGYFFRKDVIREDYNDTMKAGKAVEGAAVLGYAAGIEGGANYATAIGAYSRVTEGSEGSIALGSYSVADGTKTKGYIDDKGNKLKRLANGKFYLEEHVKLDTDGKTLVLTDNNNPEVTPDKVTQLMGVLSIGGERTLLNADGSTPKIKVLRKLEGVAPGKDDDDVVTIAQIKNLIFNGNKTVVYTDKDGNRVTKAEDGNYYAAKHVDINGKLIEAKPGEEAPKKVDNVYLSLVAPDNSTAPTLEGNTKVSKAILKNVGEGVDDTDAVNMKQLKAVSDNTIQLTGDKDSKGAAIKLSDKELKFAFTGNDDITTEAKDKAVSFTLNKATEVKEGDTKAITSGAVHTALGGYLKTDGSNIGTEDNKATFGENVGLGEISGETTKLVQEKAVKKYVDGKVGDLSKIVGSGKDGRDGKDGKDGAGQYGPSGKDGLNGKDLTEKINALRNGEAGTVVYTDKDGKRLVKANDGKYYLADDVEKDGKAKATAQAVEDVRLSLVNSEGETTKATVLANVEDGKIAENSKEAVNGGQIHKNNEEIASIFGGGAKFENGVFGKPSYEITGENGKKKYDNVGDALAALEWMNNAQEGKIAANSKFKFITDEGAVREHSLTDNLTFKGDKNISVTSKNKDNIQIALKEDISVKTIQVGETDEKGNLTNGVKAGKDGISYTAEDGTKIGIGKDGIDAGNKKITNVAAPEKDTDAANKKYVDDQVKGISDVIGNGKDGRDGKDGKEGAGQYGPSGKDGLNGKDLTEKINALRNGEAGAVVYTDKDGNRLAKANDGKYYLADKVKKDGSTEAGATAVETKDVRLSLVNSEGETTKPTVLANVADGKVEKGSKEAVNGGQLAETNGKVEQLENTITANSKFKFTTDEGEAREHALTDNLNLKGDKNISVTSKDKDNIQIALKEDISVKTIQAGETDEKGNLKSGVTAGKEGLMYKSEDGTKIVINKDGIDAGNKKISHVADGEISKDSQDAVNGKQLYATNQRIDEIENVNKKIIEKVNNNSHRIDKLDKKVNKGLANAAAMSGVEFMDIGVNQATVAAAVGGYKGTQAVAVGVQGAPTENIRVNAKMALTPGSHVESMYSVGAAYRFNFK